MPKVLAALDNSAAAWPVLAVAAETARLFGARLEAIHVREDSGGFAVAAAEAADVRLVEPEAESVPAGLLEAGRSRAVVAVVLGAGGAGPERWPPGHVALELIVGLRKPVVVVPVSARGAYVLERILVPLDATRETAAALARIVERALECDLDVVVLHVHDERSLPPFADHGGHTAEAWSREFLARYCPDAEPERLEVRVGRPDEHLTDVAARTEASMIALGWAQDLSVGRAAVVRGALARSPVPVLLVPVRRTVARAGRVAPLVGAAAAGR
jgi:hypothetical protein